MIEKLRQIVWLFQDFFLGKPLGGQLRSPKWREVRAEHMRRFPLCAICNKKGTFLKPNQAHHIKMFNTNPELELDFSNLCTLCRDDHLTFGHLKNFRSQNENLRSDIKIWNEKISNRP